eukprot:12744451-Ditylum_brightwellii.AAC.1
MGDSWFVSSVPTVESINKKVGKFKGVVKASHVLYPKDELEGLLKLFIGRTCLVMESTIDNGNKLALEKHWATCDPYLCFSTSLSGVYVTDAWRGLRYNLNSKNIDKSISMRNY